MKTFISTAIVLLGLMLGQVHAAPIENLGQPKGSITKLFNQTELSPSQLEQVFECSSKHFGKTRDQIHHMYQEGEVRIVKVAPNMARVTMKSGINEDFLDVML